MENEVLLNVDLCSRRSYEVRSGNLSEVANALENKIKPVEGDNHSKLWFYVMMKNLTLSLAVRCRGFLILLWPRLIRLHRYLSW